MSAPVQAVEKQLGDRLVRIEEFASPHRYYLVTFFEGKTPHHAGTIDAKGKLNVWTSAGAGSRTRTREVKQIILETVANWLRAGGFIPATKAQVASARREAAEGSVLVLLCTGGRRRFHETRDAINYALEALGTKKVGTQAALFRADPDTRIAKFHGPFQVFEKTGDRASSVYAAAIGSWTGPKP